MTERVRPATRYRPAWRTPVGETRTPKELGDVEMTSTGFERLTTDGFKRIDR
ncbi:hypothetical protein [Sphingobium yanoikuyae]|uniref:hypothetical protein n=1 Tax=Sphingobium yanoikuyae TaxID=13690 RepID=UPI002FDCE6D2